MQTSPNNSISTARELEDRIDAYRGQIGLQEQSIVSNKKILTNQEYTMGQNDLKINEQNQFIKAKESEIVELKAKVDVLSEEKVSLDQDIESSKQTFVKINKETNEKLDLVNKEVSNLNQYKEDLASKEAEITAREKKVHDESIVVAEKHKHIKELASKL